MKALVVLFASILAALSLADARADSPAKVTGSAARTKALAILGAVASKLEAASELDCTASVFSNVFGDTYNGTTYHMSCMVARPNLLRMEATFKDKTSYIAWSNGKVFCSLDVASAKYVKHSPPKSLASAEDAVQGDADTLRPTTLDSGLGMLLAAGWFADPDTVAEGLLSDQGVTVSDVALGRLPAICIVSHSTVSGGITDSTRVYIDKSTGLFRRFETFTTFPGKKPADTLLVDFTKFELRNNRVDAGEFSAVLPANTTAVHGFDTTVQISPASSSEPETYPELSKSDIAQVMRVHVPAPALVAARARARGILTQVESKLKSASVVTFTARSTSYGCVPIRVWGVVQQPCLHRIEATLPDKTTCVIAGNYQEMFAFYSASKTYIHRQAQTTFGQDVVIVGDDVSAVTDSKVNETSIFQVPMYVSPDIAWVDGVDEAQNVSVKDVKVDGVAETRIALEEDAGPSGGTFTYYYIDRFTGLFREIRSVATSKWQAPRDMGTTYFDTLKLAAKPQPIAAFAYSPPAGAVAITPPSIPGLP